MGIDIHEYRRYNGLSDPNPSGGTRVSAPRQSTLRKGYFKHHWTYYKARAVRKKRETEERT